MNRIEFMTQLAALLQDISVEERKEAMQYYNDYFDDAGEENEEQVVAELGSPKKVAATIKADLGNQDSREEYKEFSESGYTDTRFEQKESPAGRGSYYYNDSQEQPHSNRTLKILLIIAIIIIGAPIVIPVGIAIIAVVLAGVIAVFSIFIALVAVSVALVVAGVTMFCVGIANLIPAVAIGLSLVGAGLILTVIGVVASVASIKLCAAAIPGVIRGIVWVCRRPFQGRAVA